MSTSNFETHIAEHPFVDEGALKHAEAASRTDIIAATAPAPLDAAPKAESEFKLTTRGKVLATIGGIAAAGALLLGANNALNHITDEDNGYRQQAVENEMKRSQK